MQAYKAEKAEVIIKVHVTCPDNYEQYIPPGPGKSRDSVSTLVLLNIEIRGHVKLLSTPAAASPSSSSRPCISKRRKQRRRLGRSESLLSDPATRLPCIQIGRCTEWGFVLHLVIVYFPLFIRLYLGIIAMQRHRSWWEEKRNTGLGESSNPLMHGPVV